MSLNIPEKKSFYTTSTKDNLSELSILDEVEKNCFTIKRLYFIEGEGVRGKHFHKNCNQIIIALNKEFNVRLTSIDSKYEFSLIPLREYLIIPSNWYIELFLQAGSKALALASETFSNTKTCNFLPK